MLSDCSWRLLRFFLPRLSCLRGMHICRLSLRFKCMIRYLTLPPKAYTAVPPIS